MDRIGVGCKGQVLKVGRGCGGKVLGMDRTVGHMVRTGTENGEWQVFRTDKQKYIK